MDFKQQLKQASLEILGADATAVLDYKALDPNYLKHVLQRPFTRATDLINDLRQKNPDPFTFKQALIQVIDDKSQSGYTSKFAFSILQAALSQNLIPFNEYTRLSQQLFGVEKIDEDMKKKYLETEKENLQNRDPWSDLLN
jgi:hypothetical protein